MKKILVLIVFTLIFSMPASADNRVAPSQLGKVVAVDYTELPPLTGDNLNQTKQILTVKITKGEDKGEEIIVDNVLTNNPMYDLVLEKGDRIVLHEEDGNFFVADRQRTSALWLLGAIFSICVLIVGRKKGLFSLVSILATICLVFCVLMPLILSGLCPIFSAIFVGILSSAIAIYLVGGFNYKSTSAVLGTVLSLMFAGVLSGLSIKIAQLTGFAGEETLFLFSAHPQLDFVGILAAAMIISALGAVMDISMSIASTVNELFAQNKEMSVKSLFQSGMNVGRDIIGTMANTLILVYLGASLPLVLLSQNIDMQKFFNLNQVATEITSALVGSITLVICVPLTAIISAYLIRLEKNKFDGIINRKDD